MLYLYHPSMVSAYPGLREDLEAFAELGVATGSNLAVIPAGSLVIPRFRMLPFGKELEQEVLTLGSRLINTYRQHRAIADLSTWIGLLDGLTPPAYRVDEIPRIPDGEYFVKGETNSLKHRWFEACYAPNKAALLDVIRANYADSTVGSQELYIRPFQRYRQVATAVDGRPVFNELRVFVYRGHVVSRGVYWSNHEAALAVKPLDQSKLETALADATARTEHLADFYVIDLAEYPDGSWGVVELNDGVMAGLSANDPKLLWSKLKTLTEVA